MGQAQMGLDHHRGIVIILGVFFKPLCLGFRIRGPGDAVGAIDYLGNLLHPVAELTGYNLEYLRQLIRRGVIAAEKKGRDWWVDRADLQRYLDEMKSLGASKHDPRRGDG